MRVRQTCVRICVGWLLVALSFPSCTVIGQDSVDSTSSKGADDFYSSSSTAVAVVSERRLARILCYPADCYNDPATDLCAAQSFCKDYVKKQLLADQLKKDGELTAANMVSEMAKLIALWFGLGSVFGFIAGAMALIVLDACCYQSSSLGRKLVQTIRCGRRPLCGGCGCFVLTVGLLGVLAHLTISSSGDTAEKMSGDLVNKCLEQLTLGFFWNIGTLNGYTEVEWNIDITNPADGKLEISKFDGTTALAGSTCLYFSLSDNTTKKLVMAKEESGQLKLAVTMGYLGVIGSAVNLLIIQKIVGGYVELAFPLDIAGKFNDEEFTFKCTFTLPLASTELPDLSTLMDEGFEKEMIDQAMYVGLQGWNGEGKTIMEWETLEVEGPMITRLKAYVGCMFAIVILAAFTMGGICCAYITDDKGLKNNKQMEKDRRRADVLAARLRAHGIEAPTFYRHAAPAPHGNNLASPPPSPYGLPGTPSTLQPHPYGAPSTLQPQPYGMPQSPASNVPATQWASASPASNGAPHSALSPTAATTVAQPHGAALHGRTSALAPTAPPQSAGGLAYDPSGAYRTDFRPDEGAAMPAMPGGPGTSFEQQPPQRATPAAFSHWPAGDVNTFGSHSHPGHMPPQVTTKLADKE